MLTPSYNLTVEQLIGVLSSSSQAVAIHVTDRFIIQYASDAMIRVWGKDRSVIGMPLDEALPELDGQPFIEMFGRVWHEGITISGSDTAAVLEIDGKLQTFYFDFEYRPIKDDQGNVYCILHTATDVTERYLAQQRERAMQEEMQAANKELTAINTALLESDAKFRNLVQQAPLGLCIIRADDLCVEDVNDLYLEIVGRQRQELQNKKIWDAIPEAAELYAPVLQNVIDTGQSYIAKETEIVLLRHNIPETVFIDFVYEPIKFNGVVDSVMVIVFDVTDKVKARRVVEDMEERSRLAIEAAEAGTYDIDLVKDTIKTSPRFDAIYGFESPASWDEYTEVIHPDDRQTRLNARQKAAETGRLLTEFRVIHKDQSVHWVKVYGQTYFDKEKRPRRLLGIVIDITDQKLLQQQKDDFLSIASHELKTPITSLKASIQLMDRIKNDPDPQKLTRLIDQSVKSMDKVSALVEDLLNVSRANQSQLHINKSRTNIKKLLDNCCIDVRADGVYTITVNAPDELMVNADEHAIDQVITNLVNNAVKYAPASKKIVVSARKEGDLAYIAVQDFGPGIPQDKLPYLFDRYYRVDSTAYGKSGLGLGLYICSEIIKKHGGQIGVESQLGKGTTFYFYLPIN